MTSEIKKKCTHLTTIFCTEEHVLCGVVAAPGALHYSHFPNQRPSHLTTNRSYDKNFLEKIAIQTAVKKKLIKTLSGATF